jgi:hypothetical protein
MGEVEIVITMLYELGEVVKIEMEAANQGSPIRYQTLNPKPKTLNYAV